MHFGRQLLALVLGISLLSLCSCKTKPKAGPQPKAGPPKAAAPASIVDKVKAPPALKAASTSNACVGALGASTPVATFKAGSISWERKGAVLTAKRKATGKFVVGLIASTKDASPGNVKNWNYFSGEFKKAGVEFVFAIGDLGRTFKDLVKVFVHFGHGHPWALGVLPGNGDSQHAFNWAIRRLSAHVPNLVDLTAVRQIKGDGIDFITLPGYFKSFYLRAKDGCSYLPSDVQALEAVIKAAKNPVALVSHGPPQGKSKTSIDYAIDTNAGDPALAALIGKLKVPFGLFAHIHEAGARGVGADFSTVIKPGTAVANLHVNCGGALSQPWELLDGKVSHGRAMVVTFEKGKASYSVLAAPAPPKAKRVKPSKKTMETKKSK